MKIAALLTLTLAGCIKQTPRPTPPPTRATETLIGQAIASCEIYLAQGVFRDKQNCIAWNYRVNSEAQADRRPAENLGPTSLTKGTTIK